MTTQWNFLDGKTLQCPAGQQATIYGRTGLTTNPASSIATVCLKCEDTDMGCMKSSYLGGLDYTVPIDSKNITYYNYPSATKGYSKFVRFMDNGRTDDRIVEDGKTLGSVLKTQTCENGMNGFYVERYENPADKTNIDLANFMPSCAAKSYDKNKSVLVVNITTNLPKENTVELNVLSTKAELLTSTLSTDNTMLNTELLTVPVTTELDKSTNMYKIPLINSPGTEIITVGTGNDMIIYSVNKYKSEVELNEFIHIRTSDMMSKKANLPIEESLGGDITMKVHIPVLENDTPTMKEIAIRSDGSLAVISNRNLYILLVLILVVLIVVYMKYTNSNNKTYPINTQT